MTEQELQQYLKTQYPKENEGCEWKEFKNLKNDFNGKEKDDVISYVSALVCLTGIHDQQRIEGSQREGVRTPGKRQ